MSRPADPYRVAIDVLRSEIASIADEIAGEAAVVPPANASSPEAVLIEQAAQITRLAEAVGVLRERRRAER